MAFSCNFCNKNFNTFRLFHSHLKVHKNTTGSFQCRLSPCRKSFNKYNTYLSHYYRNHKTSETIMAPNNISNTICKKCHKKFVKTLLLIKHSFFHLKFDKIVKCCFDLCDAVYRNNQSYRSHLSNVHNFRFKYFTKPISQASINNIISVNSVSMENTGLENNTAIEEIPVSEISESASSSFAVSHTLSFIYFKLKYEHNVPDGVINSISDTINSNLIPGIIQKFSEELFTITQNNNINDHVRNEIEYTFKNVFKENQLRTNYMRNKYYREQFNFISPIKIELGKNNSHQDCHYYYVPILEVIKSLISEKEICELIVNSNIPETQPNTLSDYHDGTAYKRNSFFNSDQKIEIILFADAFNICNPLGSAKNKHKQLAVYFTLGNIPPSMRLNSDNIQLVLLVYDKYLKEFSIQKIFEQF